jgi:uncharacterized protein YecE (DUF72 family)
LLIDFLEALPETMRAVFEFRHASWHADDVFETLRKNHAALCLAESDDLVTPRVATAPFGYLRLRREDYSGAELAHWARWIRRQPWTEVFLYFKHEEKGVGPAFATSMQKLLPTITEQ